MAPAKKIVGVGVAKIEQPKSQDATITPLAIATNGEPKQEDHVMTDGSSELSEHEIEESSFNGVAQVVKNGINGEAKKNGAVIQEAKIAEDQPMENGVDAKEVSGTTNGVDKKNTATTNGIHEKKQTRVTQNVANLVNGNGATSSNHNSIVEISDGEDQPMEDAPVGNQDEPAKGKPTDEAAGDKKKDETSRGSKADGAVNGTQSPANGHPKAVAFSTTVPATTATPPAANSLRHERDVLRLTTAISEVSEEAAQQVFKAKWRNVLFKPSNDDYLSFILRAGLKNATGAAIEKTFKDNGIFKDGLVQKASGNKATREAVLKSVTAEEVIQHVSLQVLDEAVAHRIQSASADDLVMWLANANRLGFHPDDLVDQKTELVTPHAMGNQHAMGFPPPHFGSLTPQEVHEQQKQEQERQRHALMVEQHRLAQLQMVNQSTGDPLLDEQNRQLELSRQSGNLPPPKQKKSNGVPGRKSQAPRDSSDQDPEAVMKCPSCGQTFESANGYQFHIDKKVCLQTDRDLGKPERSFTDQCPYCKKLFTGKQGLLYHSKKNVCNGYPTAPVSTSPANIAPAPAPMHSLMPIQHFTPANLTPRPIHNSPPSDSSTPLPANASFVAIKESSPSNQLHLEAAANSPRPSPPSRSRETSLPTKWAVPVLPLRSSSDPDSHTLPSNAPGYPPLGSNGVFPGTPVRPERAYKPRQSTLPTPATKTPITHAGRLRDSSDIKPGRNHSPSELPQEQLDQMNARLRDCDVNFEAAVRNMNPDLNEEDRKKKLASLKQGNASKKSMIRREYGVTIRAKREKDDTSEAGSAPSSISKSKLDKRKSTSHLIEQSPAISGFSPINKPIPSSTPSHPPPTPTPIPQDQAHSPPAYSPPAPRSFTPVQRTYSNPPGPNNQNYPASVISHDGRPPIPPPGFMAVPHWPGQSPHALDMNMQPQGPALNGARKRRRQESQGSNTLNVVEVPANDATTSLAKRKKIPVNATTQANWEALQDRSSGADTPMTEASPEAEAAAPVINLDTTPERTPEVEATTSAPAPAAAVKDEVLPSVEVDGPGGINKAAVTKDDEIAAPKISPSKEVTITTE